MKRAFMALALIISLLGAAWVGHYKGYGDAYVAWEAQIESAYSAMEEGTYQMAWTNVRACVLAVDSAAMRFLSQPTPEGVNELRARYEACEQHWELLFEYAPEGDEIDRSISEARWMFDNWGDQISHVLKLNQIMLIAHGAGRTEQALDLYKRLIEERNESRKFRDHIERELFEAW
jgi:hypothetical protein